MIKYRFSTFLCQTVIWAFASVSFTCFAEPIHSDDFDDGISRETTSKGFTWTETASVIEEQHPDEQSNKVAAFHFKGSTGDSGDAWSELRFKLDKLYPELWVRYKLYVPKNYYHRNSPGSDNNKGYFMFWSGTYNNGSNVLVASSWWRDGNGGTKLMGQWKTNTEMSRHHEEKIYSGQAIDINTDLGKWQDVVIRVKIADFAQKSNGALQIWKNKELINSHLNIENYSRDGIKNGIDQGYLLGWSNSGFNEETVFFVDDFKIGTKAEDVQFNAITKLGVDVNVIK